MLADLLCPHEHRLYGRKIFLRRLTNDDINTTYLAWLNDPEVNQFSQRRGVVTEMDELRTYVDNNENTSQTCILGIYYRESEEHIGNIMLSAYDVRHKTAEIANLIGEKKYWGCGIAFDADHTLLLECFCKHGFRKIEIGNIPQNRAATFLSKQLGFTLEGRLRNQVLIEELGECDILRFGILRQEFLEKWVEPERLHKYDS